MPTRVREGRGQELALTAVVVIVVVLFSLLPMLRLIDEIAAPHGTLTGEAIMAGLSSPATWLATWHTLVIGIGGTLLAVLSGTLVAILVTLTDIRGRSALALCYIVPLMIAPQVTALAWLQLFGPASPLLKLLGAAPPIGTRNPLYSTAGIILLLGVQYGPLVFLLVRAGLRKLPRELIEAARASGGGWVSVLFTIVLPLMTPSIMAAAALAFVSCVGNFGIPAFLGIPANYLVLPTLIYQRLAGGGQAALGEAAFLSVLIGIIAMAGILAQEAMSRRRDYRISSASPPAEPYELGCWRLPVQAVMWLLIILVLFLPLFGLALTSLVPGYGIALTTSTATLDNYRFVLLEHSAASRAFLNSFWLSVAAAFFAVIAALPVGYLIAWSKSRWVRLLNLSVELPYAMPGVVLAVASLLLFLRPIPLTGIQLYDTAWIILYAYLARFLVLALRPAVSGYHQIADSDPIRTGIPT